MDSDRLGRTLDWIVGQVGAISQHLKETQADLADFHRQTIKRFDHLERGRTNPPFYAKTPSSKERKKALRDRERVERVDKWMEANEVFNLPITVQIKEEPKVIKEEHEEEDGLIDKEANEEEVLAIDPVIGAIAAGNVVVLKPSEIAPSTSALFARLLPKYVDNSCIKVVEGTVPETTALLEHKWDKILYTGYAKVGRIIMAAAAKHLTPVVLELGGKCPVVVDFNVDLKVASKMIVVGKWGSNNGQACIAPDYIITTKSFAPQLVDALKISLKSFYGENPMQSEDLSRIVNSNHFARIIRLLDDEKISGKIIHGGERDEKLLKIAPTLLLDVPDDSLIMQEEIFGPLLPIVTVDNIEESIDMINSKPKPLSAYLFTKNKKLEEKFVRAVSAGGLLINDTIMHFANPNLPFGGVGESGIGAYHGKFSFDAFSHRKAVLHRSFGGEVSARYPPYTAQKQKFLRALLSGDIIGVILAIIGFPRS